MKAKPSRRSIREIFNYFTRFDADDCWRTRQFVYLFFFILKCSLVHYGESRSACDINRMQFFVARYAVNRNQKIAFSNYVSFIQWLVVTANIDVFISIFLGRRRCSDGDLVYQSNLEDPQNFHATKCNPKERFAILLHGWRESCNTTWMKQLVGSKLATPFKMSEHLLTNFIARFLRTWQISRWLHHVHGLQ